MEKQDRKRLFQVLQEWMQKLLQVEMRSQKRAGRKSVQEIQEKVMKSGFNGGLRDDKRRQNQINE